ncbi:43235_t:CDS:2 [Gigaspora margarita]|uniref:43235_t:CDS:1 n=1 Tax=Gigaspora margarita TaxID=4874 RepID=A0ABN7VQ50_GIGMA|nr:43235_t:CDS:2 [Gigaspora margarita]
MRTILMETLEESSIEPAEICHLKQKRVSQVKLAERFGIAEATISGIIREKERTGKFPLLKDALALWVLQANIALQTVTGAIIQCKATQFAKKLEATGFNTSDGWLSKFKKRHHIKEYKRLELIKNYHPEDVYNADETALYWRIEPDKTLANGPISGQKKAKDHVTVLLTCNATGSHKPAPLFIYKFKTLWALKNIDKSTLPRFDEQMRLAGQSILLILDGASTHGLEDGLTLTNIKLHFFPSRTTAHLQPCDAGIIWSFKANYKKFFCEDCINAFDEFLEFSGDPPKTITIKDAIGFTTATWSKVTPKIIRNCWKKTGILPQDFLNKLYPHEEPDQINKSDITSEIQNLIWHLPLDQPMNAEEYITADNHLITTEMPNDEEIIEAIKNHEYIEPEDEVTNKPISFIQAFGFMNGILSFLEQQPDSSFNVDDSLIRNLAKLKKEVKLKYIASQ